MSKIYIVSGHIRESGDEDTWVEELFLDEEQAKACATYFNMTSTQKNVTFFVNKYDDFCTEDYVSKLEELMWG